jgi:hypothetical protein
VLGAPVPPGGDPSTVCCTDYLEEQLPPTAAFGTELVVPHSPIRSTGGFVEPDVLRVMAGAVPAQVKTGLPGAFATFALQPGQVRDIWAQSDTVLTASAPVLVAQVLVSESYTTVDQGGPSLLFVSPLGEHRREHTIHTPPTWASDHVAIATPAGNTILLDGQPLGAGCTTSAAGVIGATSYEAVRCKVAPGTHRLVATAPVAVYLYGYGVHGTHATAAAGW